MGDRVIASFDGAPVRAVAFHGKRSMSKRKPVGAGDFLAGGRLAEPRHFLHRAIGLIDSRVGVGESFGVGIRDRDSSKGLTANYAGLLIFRPIRVEKRIVLVGVAMRPTIDRDRLNVARRIEAGG